jgi:hypothetical protein
MRSVVGGWTVVSAGEEGPMLDLHKRDDYIEIDVAGTLTSRDYESLIPELEQSAAERGPLRLYIELHDFEGWTPAALWKEVRFDISHQDDMDRVAIVGERSMEKWMTKLTKPFFKADMQFFTPDNAEKAMKWVRDRSRLS